MYGRAAAPSLSLSLGPATRLRAACPAVPPIRRRARDDRVQLLILGEGGKVRQVLLPDIVSRSLLSLRGDAGSDDPVFPSRKGGRLTERAVNGMVKRAARKAGINEAVSPHWLRHTHGSHAIDRGARFALGVTSEHRNRPVLLCDLGNATRISVVAENLHATNRRHPELRRRPATLP